MFTDEEQDQLRSLPRKEYIVEHYTPVLAGISLVDTRGDASHFIAGLFDIVYAYAYNHRVTMGENNVESAWTICKLSPSLSCLEVV